MPSAPNRPKGKPKLPFRVRSRAGGRPFKKGHKKLGGRPKGTGNFVTYELREFFQKFYETPEYQQSLQGRLLDGKAQTIELNGWHVTIGKPKESVEVSRGTLDELFSIAAEKGLGSKQEQEEA